MKCPGFQRVSGSEIAPVAVIQPVSDVNGSQQKITIKVLKVKMFSSNHYACLFTPSFQIIGRFDFSRCIAFITHLDIHFI